MGSSDPYFSLARASARGRKSTGRHRILVDGNLEVMELQGHAQFCM